MFCKQCGKELPDSSLPRCPSCNTKIGSGGRFCAFCGSQKKLSTGSTECVICGHSFSVAAPTNKPVVSEPSKETSNTKHSSKDPVNIESSQSKIEDVTPQSQKNEHSNTPSEVDIYNEANISNKTEKKDIVDSVNPDSLIGIVLRRGNTKNEALEAIRAEAYGGNIEIDPVTGKSTLEAKTEIEQMERARIDRAIAERQRKTETGNKKNVIGGLMSNKASGKTSKTQSNTKSKSNTNVHNKTNNKITEQPDDIDNQQTDFINIDDGGELLFATKDGSYENDEGETKDLNASKVFSNKRPSNNNYNRTFEQKSETEVPGVSEDDSNGEDVISEVEKVSFWILLKNKMGDFKQRIVSKMSASEDMDEDANEDTNEENDVTNAVPDSILNVGKNIIVDDNEQVKNANVSYNQEQKTDAQVDDNVKPKVRDTHLTNNDYQACDFKQTEGEYQVPYENSGSVDQNQSSDVTENINTIEKPVNDEQSDDTTLIPGFVVINTDNQAPDIETKENNQAAQVSKSQSNVVDSIESIPAKQDKPVVIDGNQPAVTPKEPDIAEEHNLSDKLSDKTGITEEHPLQNEDAVVSDNTLSNDSLVTEFATTDVAPDSVLPKDNGVLKPDTSNQRVFALPKIPVFQKKPKERKNSIYVAVFNKELSEADIQLISKYKASDTVAFGVAPSKYGGRLAYFNTAASTADFPYMINSKPAQPIQNYRPPKEKKFVLRDFFGLIGVLLGILFVALSFLKPDIIPQKLIVSFACGLLALIFSSIGSRGAKTYLGSLGVFITLVGIIVLFVRIESFIDGTGSKSDELAGTISSFINKTFDNINSTVSGEVSTTRILNNRACSVSPLMRTVD